MTDCAATPTRNRLFAPATRLDRFAKAPQPAPTLRSWISRTLLTQGMDFYDLTPDGRIGRVVGFFGAPPAP
jgi:hypothetical protein